MRASGGGDLLFGKIFTYDYGGGETEDLSFADTILAFARDVITASGDSLRRGKADQERLLKGLAIMYYATFVVGIIAFVLAVIKGFTADKASEVAGAAVFGGLSGVLFLAFFILRPTASIERASIANTWMNLSTNSYWTRVAFALRREPDQAAGRERDQRLSDSTSEAITQLASLLAASARSEREYLAFLQQTQSGAPYLQVVAPTPPAELPTKKGSTLKGIKLQVSPDGAGLDWSIDGDDDGRLVQTAPGQFEYTRGSAAADDVTLHFAMADHSNASADLSVVAPTT